MVPPPSPASLRTEALLHHLAPVPCNSGTDSTAKPNGVNGTTASAGVTVPPPIPAWVADTLPGPWQQCHARFGHGPIVRKWLQDGKGHLLLKKWREEFGPIFAYIVYEPALSAAGLRVIISDPQEAKRVLKMNPVKPPGYQTSVILGEGVLSNTDPVEWARQRELLKPAFTNSALKELMPVMLGGVKELLAQLNLEAKAGHPMDIHELLSAYAFLIIGHSALGEEDEFLTRRAQKLRAAFDVVTYKEIQRVNIEKDDDYRVARDEIRSFTSETLERYERRSAGSCPVKHKESLLSIVMSNDKNGCPHMNPRQRSDELSTFMFAGHETTAHTMSWAILELARHPRCQQKLQKEVDTLLASIGGIEKLEYKDLFKLEYLTLVINETLRLWPVVANGTFRLLEEDTQIMGKTIPKNTIISFPHILLHHDKGIWGEDADTFNPERKWFPDSFTPFTVSPRDCLGRNLAMMEMRITLLTIFHNFNVTLKDPGLVYQGFNTFTLFPEHGVWVNLERRR